MSQEKMHLEEPDSIFLETKGGHEWLKLSFPKRIGFVIDFFTEGLHMEGDSWFYMHC